MCVCVCVCLQSAVLCSAALKAQGSAKLTHCLSNSLAQLLNTFAEALGNKLKGPILSPICRRGQQHNSTGDICCYPQCNRWFFLQADRSCATQKGDEHPTLTYSTEHVGFVVMFVLLFCEYISVNILKLYSCIPAGPKFRVWAQRIVCGHRDSKGYLHYSRAFSSSGFDSWQSA